MASLRPYRLTVLLHPQASKDDRRAVETLVTEWAKKYGGEAKPQREESRKTAYPVKHQSQAVYLRFALAASPEGARELTDQLRLQKPVLRHRVLAGEPVAGKRLKEAPPKRPETGLPAKALAEAGDRRAALKDLKTVAPKEKAPLEKLEEKIDEILKEEVL